MRPASLAGRARARLSTAWIEVHRELVVDKSLSDAPGSTCLGSSKLHLVVLVHLCVGHAQIVICLSRQRKSMQSARLQRGYVPILDVTLLNRCSHAAFALVGQ